MNAITKQWCKRQNKGSEQPEQCGELNDRSNPPHLLLVTPDDIPFRKGVGNTEPNPQLLQNTEVLDVQFEECRNPEMGHLRTKGCFRHKAVYALATPRLPQSIRGRERSQNSSPTGSLEFPNYNNNN